MEALEALEATCSTRCQGLDGSPVHYICTRDARVWIPSTCPSSCPPTPPPMARLCPHAPHGPHPRVPGSPLGGSLGGEAVDHERVRCTPQGHVMASGRAAAYVHLRDMSQHGALSPTRGAITCCVMAPHVLPHGPLDPLAPDLAAPEGEGPHPPPHAGASRPRSLSSRGAP